MVLGKKRIWEVSFSREKIRLCDEGRSASLMTVVRVGKVGRFQTMRFPFPYHTAELNYFLVPFKLFNANFLSPRFQTIEVGQHKYL